MTDLPELTPTAQAHIQSIVEIARGEVERARTSITETGPAREQHLEEARASVRRATTLPFNAYAQEHLQANRADLLSLLPAICRKVELDISCPSFEAVVSETAREQKEKWTYRMSIEAAVANPGLWRDLSDEFAILAKEEREIRGRGRLIATGVYKRGNDFGYWILPSCYSQARYDAVAKRAGMALDSSRGLTPSFYHAYWLHSLSVYLSTNDSPHRTPAEGGQHYKTCTLHNLPEASETFGSRLEECALANEQRQKKTGSMTEAPTRLTRINEERNEPPDTDRSPADVSWPVDISALTGEEPTSARSAVPSNFSERDKKLHDELIRLKGRECFRQHKDALLIREHLRNARASLNDKTMTPPAMRACLRRIRHYYNYPLSHQITNRS